MLEREPEVPWLSQWLSSLGGLSLWFEFSPTWYSWKVYWLQSHPWGDKLVNGIDNDKGSSAFHFVIIFFFVITVVSCQVMSNSFATPWTITHQVPLSMGFPRQGYWSGLPFSAPGDLPDPGTEPSSLVWQVDSLPLIHQGSLIFSLNSTKQYHLLVLNHSFSQQIFAVCPLGPSTMLYKMNGNFPNPLT